MWGHCEEQDFFTNDGDLSTCTEQDGVPTAIVGLFRDKKKVNPAVPDCGENIALGKSYSCSNGVASCNTKQFTDGSHDSAQWKRMPYKGGLSSCDKQMYVTVDLVKVTKISEVTLWRYSDGSRKYCGTKVELSNDGISWTVAHDDGEEYTPEVESAAGYLMRFGTEKLARYVRVYSSRNTKNSGAHLLDVAVTCEQCHDDCTNPVSLLELSKGVAHNTSHKMFPGMGGMMGGGMFGGGGGGSRGGPGGPGGNTGFDTTKAIDDGSGCDETIRGGRQIGYRGCQDHTRSGLRCQKWTSQSPHKHTTTPTSYPIQGVGDHNYCRNPTGEETIWCYTTSTAKRWEFCDPKPASCDETLTGDGANYRGCQNEARSGRKCQLWTMQSPHAHETTPANYPPAGLGDHNYCRNPDERETIWCYTRSTDSRWEFCDPLGPKKETCDETMKGPGNSGYRGCQSTTKSGKMCQQWTEQWPHKHSRTADNFPDTGLGEHNYCRNPDGEQTIWCYTTNPAVRWEYCEEIPFQAEPVMPTYEQNVALYKPVTCHPGMDSCPDAATVTDDNKNSADWKIHPWAAAFSCSDQYWVEVDLEEVFSISEATLWRRHDEGQRYCGTKVEISADGSNWETVVDRGTSEDPEETAEGTHLPFGGVKYARFVRFHSSKHHKGTGVHFLEVAVTCSECDPLVYLPCMGNQALDKAVTCHEGNTMGMVCTNAHKSRAVDGDHTPARWQMSPFSTAPTCDHRAAVEVDLGYMQLIDEVTLFRYYGDQREYCGTKIEVSIDGNNWLPVRDDGNGFAAQESSTGTVLSFSGSFPARYIRAWSSRNTRNEGVHLMDLEVHCHSCCEADESETLVCPEGSVQVGAHNADVSGCGLTSCDDRYHMQTIDECEQACSDHPDCKGFNWAPVGGDKNHLSETVCTLYDQAQPSGMWGPNQIFCKQMSTISFTKAKCCKLAEAGYLNR
jgi:hypothetical protein